MNISGLRGGAATLILTLFGAACRPGAPAAPDVHVEGVWARPTRAMTMEGDSSRSANVTSAVYLELYNRGGLADTLVGANTDVARATEIHESNMDGNVMRMRQVSRVEIPPGETVQLKPGGYHLMLIGVVRDLAVGDEFVVTLSLAQGGDLPVEVVVRQPE